MVWKSYCDRCGAEGDAIQIEDLLTTYDGEEEMTLLATDEVWLESWPDGIRQKYSVDGSFLFQPELCRSCLVALARLLVHWLELEPKKK